MPTASTQSHKLGRSRSKLKLGRSRSSAFILDKYAIIPIAVFVFALIIAPVLIYFDSATSGSSLASRLQNLMTPRPENRFVWPALAAISVFLAFRNWFRLTWPPNIICLITYLAFAGVSALWAFKPELSFIRFVAQVMILTSILLPTMLAAPTADIMRGLFLCYAFALALNLFFVHNQSPIYYDNVNIGYPGYFPFKGHLGECAVVAFLLSLHEMLYSGHRRALGIMVVIAAIYLTILSKSKGSFGIGIIAPLLAGITLITCKRMRLSPAIALLPIPIFYAVFSKVYGNLVNRISWYLYGNYTLSGRTIIWDFANYEIARKPLLGWGYQSFWLVGPDAPSIVDAPGWVKTMPSAHNGYLDTMLEMGDVGLALLLIFIMATLHAIGRVLDRDPARAWLLLSLALFVILTNFLESNWMRGADTLWLIFVILSAEAGRYWRTSRLVDRR
jgi:exopolysaccharide production protein ExoQ